MPGQLTNLERSELKDWARKLRDTIAAVERNAYPLDIGTADVH